MSPPITPTSPTASPILPSSMVSSAATAKPESLTNLSAHTSSIFKAYKDGQGAGLHGLKGAKFSTKNVNQWQSAIDHHNPSFGLTKLTETLGKFIAEAESRNCKKLCLFTGKDSVVLKIKSNGVKIYYKPEEDYPQAKMTLYTTVNDDLTKTILACLYEGNIMTKSLGGPPPSLVEGDGGDAPISPMDDDTVEPVYSDTDSLCFGSGHMPNMPSPPGSPGPFNGPGPFSGSGSFNGPGSFSGPGSICEPDYSSDSDAADDPGASGGGGRAASGGSGAAARPTAFKTPLSPPISLKAVPINTISLLYFDLSQDMRNGKGSLTPARVDHIVSPRPAVNDPFFKESPEIAASPASSPTSVHKLFSVSEEPVMPTLQELIAKFQGGIGIKLAGPGEILDLEKTLDKELQELNELETKYSAPNTRSYACQSEIRVLIEGQSNTRHRIKDVFISIDSTEGRKESLVEVIGEMCERAAMNLPEIKNSLDKIEKEHQDRADAKPKPEADELGFPMVRSFSRVFGKLKSSASKVVKSPVSKPPSQ